MANVSHNGSVVTIAGSVTLGGIPQIMTSFPKDTDPLTVEDRVVGGMELGTNSTPIIWNESNPSVVTISVIPNTQDHAILNIFLSANTPRQGKVTARDEFVLTRILPNGSLLTASKGVIISGSPASGMSSNMRLKTVSYKFSFSEVNDRPVIA